jgi:transposase
MLPKTSKNHRRCKYIKQKAFFKNLAKPLKCRYNYVTTHKGDSKLAAIIKNKSGKYIYLYESESYRDEEGKVRNKRRIVGKVDPITGQHVYKPEYIEEKGISVVGADAQETKLYSANDVKHSTVKEWGVYYLLNEISREIGLVDVLVEAMPAMWREVLHLAFFIVASGEPALYCEDWLYKTECDLNKELSSQRISELLVAITQGERMSFFERWGEYRCENEYIALDITSISTYSELINTAEWGYNRDKEKLPQINICMLLGEKSRLPVLQMVYSGSLKDVSTLRNTLQAASNLNLTNMSVVMDKGFASAKNINAMLPKSSAIRFLIALPFTMAFAKNQVTSEAKDIDCVENTIAAGSDTLRGITKRRTWNTKHDVYAHVYLNPDAALRARNKLYAKTQELIAQLKREPEGSLNHPDVKKYLIVRKSDKSGTGYTINIRHDVISNELANAGWLVIISNHVDNAENAIYIYRDKDVVEKGFLRMKNCLDLARLRVHSDNAMQNKIFIGFIALIVTAHIHKIMSENRMYATWTMKKLIKTLERLKVHHIKSDRIVSPLTKEQKQIFKIFNLKCDV